MEIGRAYITGNKNKERGTSIEIEQDENVYYNLITFDKTINMKFNPKSKELSSFTIPWV